ncbi:hypothetical protein JHK86_033681 [Glycine max]|nr:hypothetical protein JHK86_033681 [Glycine max]
MLDYLTKLDWDNHCVSLKGPVSKTSLPNIVVEVPENGRNMFTAEMGFLALEAYAPPKTR